MSHILLLLHLHLHLLYAVCHTRQTAVMCIEREMSSESLCATPSSPFEVKRNSQLRVAIQRERKRKTIFSF